MASCLRWRCIPGAVISLIGVLQVAIASADDRAPDAAAQIAQRYGLVKITGRVWGLPSEQQLRARLKRLPELRERIVTAQKELDEKIQRNDAAWKLAAPAIDALEKQLAQLPSSDPQRELVREQLIRLKAEAIPPAELAARDSVRGLLSRLGQDRCLLAIDLLWIRKTTAAMTERYRELADDSDLTRLIQATGDQCRLGPARNYRPEVRKLQDYNKLAFAPQAPIYLQSGRVRVTAVIGDSACATFSWSEESDAVTYLPESLVRSAGIAIPADARQETLRIGGRTIDAREIFLPSLRLGSCQAQSVAAFVLPPEAEDLGAQLTPLALSPCRAKVEHERLRMVLQ